MKKTKIKSFSFSLSWLADLKSIFSCQEVSAFSQQLENSSELQAHHDRLYVLEVSSYTSKVTRTLLKKPYLHSLVHMTQNMPMSQNKLFL